MRVPIMSHTTHNNNNNTVEEVEGGGWTLRRLMGIDDDAADATTTRRVRRLPHLLHLHGGERFRPQTDYPEPHGGRMCTAVCYAVAHAFLLGPTPAYPLPTVGQINAAMHACHRFLGETGQRQPLMLAELQRWFPTPLSQAEVAGLTTGGGAAQDIEDGPLLTPLDVLLHDMCHRTGSLPVALLVTVQEHTWALLSRGHHPPHHLTAPPPPPPLYLFDPLRDALCALGPGSVLALLPPGEPYAGLLLGPPPV